MSGNRHAGVVAGLFFYRLFIALRASLPLGRIRRFGVTSRPCGQEFIIQFQASERACIHPLAARDARAWINTVPQEKEGAGNAGCPLHPQPRVRCLESTRVSHHRFTGTPGISCAMVLTAYFALPPGTGLSCPRHRRDAKHRRQLDASVGASGPHGFAVRGSVIRLVTRPRPPHPAPTSVTMRNAPLAVRDSAQCAADLGMRSTMPTRGRLARRANQARSRLRSCDVKKPVGCLVSYIKSDLCLNIINRVILDDGHAELERERSVV